MKLSVPRFAVIIPALLLLFSLSGCAFKSITRHKNIVYQQALPAKKIEAQALNVFAPRKHKTPKDVLIFIHGGSWNSGHKSLYNFFGSRLARKDVVAVIIDYPLSPAATYNDMANASAKAVEWVMNNIAQYGGNPDKIFVSGHSAGGHLAALITVRNEYFDTLRVNNPLKGAILIDAAALDMYGYLKNERKGDDKAYPDTFTTNPVYWKDASPLYHLHSGMPSMLIYRGGKTYPSIINGSERFVKALQAYTPKPQYHILKGKKHIPMITQFFWPYNRHYKEIIAFMHESK